MEHIISEILEWCQNDMKYLQEIINNLQNIVNDSEEQEREDERKWVQKDFYMKNMEEQT